MAADKASPKGMLLPISTFATRNPSWRWVIATTLPPSPGACKSKYGMLSPVPKGSLAKSSATKRPTSLKVTFRPWNEGGDAAQCWSTGAVAQAESPGNSEKSPTFFANDSGFHRHFCEAGGAHDERFEHMSQKGPGLADMSSPTMASSDVAPCTDA